MGMDEALKAGDAIVWRIPGVGGRGFLPDVPGIVTAVGRRGVVIEIALPEGRPFLCEVRPEALSQLERRASSPEVPEESSPTAEEPLPHEEGE